MDKVYCKDCKCWDNTDSKFAPTKQEGMCHFWPPNGNLNQFLLAVPTKTLDTFYCFQGIPKK